MNNATSLDRRERFEDMTTTILAALRGWQSDLWTACPGIIQSYDPVTQSCSVQLSLLIPIQGSAGTNVGDVVDQASGLVHKQVPLLGDVPVIFPRAGGFALTFPVNPNDECLVVFSSRCIDQWWAQGGIANKLSEFRLHDLSDGFAIPGPASQPKKLVNVSTTSTQLRSEDGTDYVEVKQGHIININTATANITTSGATNITATGKVTVAGSEVDLIGAGGAAKGVVQGDCVCAFTGAPHPMVSGKVKGSL